MSEAKELLNAGIIGAGFMGKTYARTLSSLVEGVRFAGVAGGSYAPELAREYGVPCFDTPEQLAEDNGIDAVFVATPHAIHAENALAAVRAGKHVFIDKPMAHSVEACDEILDGCRAGGLKCSITFAQRNRIGFLKAKEVIDSGALGRVLHVRTYHVISGGMDALPKWQMAPENLGVLFGHGIHNFDGLRALTGREISSVFAKCRSISGAAVEGTSDVLATLDDGTVHYLFCSFEVSKPGFPRTGFAARIDCEGGLIDMDCYGETRLARNGGDFETLAIQPPIDWAGQGFLDPTRLKAYAAMIQDWTESIREDREPVVTGWDGRQAVAAAIAAYESSRSGKEVALASCPPAQT